MIEVLADLITASIELLESYVAENRTRRIKR